MNDDEKLGEAIMAWITLVRILFGACVLGLVLTIVKLVLDSLGIPNPL
jgi:Flp pilus assembly protein protease CpaA